MGDYLPSQSSSDAPHPPHPLKMGQQWLSLLVGLVLFGTYLASHQGGLTGFVVAPLDSTNQSANSTFPQWNEAVTVSFNQSNASTVDDTVTINSLTGAAVITSSDTSFYYTDANPSDFVMEHINISTTDGTFLFDSKLGKYLYVSPFDIANSTELSFAFLTREDFTYAPSEFVTMTLLFYSHQGEVIQTQTISYDNDEIVVYESATGVTILSTLYVPDGDRKKLALDVALSPTLGASSVALMFQPDSSVVNPSPRHVFITGVIIDGS